MSKMKDTRKLFVEIRRESSDGKIFTQVNKRFSDEKDTQTGAVVIDRQSGRHLDLTTMEHRAESLAKLIGATVYKDLTWHCAAHRKLKCSCPKCIKEGRA